MPPPHQFNKAPELNWVFQYANGPTFHCEGKMCLRRESVILQQHTQVEQEHNRDGHLLNLHS